MRGWVGGWSPGESAVLKADGSINNLFPIDLIALRLLTLNCSPPPNPSLRRSQASVDGLVAGRSGGRAGPTATLLALGAEKLRRAQEPREGVKLGRAAVAIGVSGGGGGGGKGREGEVERGGPEEWGGPAPSLPSCSDRSHRKALHPLPAC